MKWNLEKSNINHKIATIKVIMSIVKLQMVILGCNAFIAHLLQSASTLSSLSVT